MLFSARLAGSCYFHIVNNVVLFNCFKRNRKSGKLPPPLTRGIPVNSGKDEKQKKTAAVENIGG